MTRHQNYPKTVHLNVTSDNGVLIEYLVPGDPHPHLTHVPADLAAVLVARKVAIYAPAVTR